MNKKNCCVLIPSLSPDRRLPDYVKALLAAGFGGVVVVNDGSKPEYNSFFDECAAQEGCFVTGYSVNRGKGYALRTGIRYIRENTSFDGIITADSDGQHTPEDTEKMAEKLDSNSGLLLGSRDFTSSNPNIPPRSRFGNRITSLVFKLFYGTYLPDTQTGLRAFSRSLFTKMEEVTGDRFEYEMNVLIHCSKDKIPMAVVPIDTVYLEENKSSHFNTVKDSWRIYKLMIGTFIRFIGVSLLCWLIDNLLFDFLLYCVLPQKETVRWLMWDVSSSLLIAYFAARAVSATVNFTLNRKAVFCRKGGKNAILRYICLALCCLLISATVTAIVDHFVPGIAWLIKLIVDLVMFCANYKVQEKWVFPEEKNEEKKA